MQKRVRQIQDLQTAMYAAWRAHDHELQLGRGRDFPGAPAGSCLDEKQENFMPAYCLDETPRSGIRLQIVQLWEQLAGTRKARDDDDAVRDWVEKDVFATMFVYIGRSTY